MIDSENRTKIKTILPAVDTPLSESRFADMLEGWVDEEREVHDEHDEHKLQQHESDEHDDGDGDDPEDHEHDDHDNDNEADEDEHAHDDSQEVDNDKEEVCKY